MFLKVLVSYIHVKYEVFRHIKCILMNDKTKPLILSKEYPFILRISSNSELFVPLKTNSSSKLLKCFDYFFIRRECSLTCRTFLNLFISDNLWKRCLVDKMVAPKSHNQGHAMFVRWCMKSVGVHCLGVEFLRGWVSDRHMIILCIQSSIYTYLL